MSPSEAQLREVLNGVEEPEIGLSLGRLDLVGAVRSRRGKVSVTIRRIAAAHPQEAHLVHLVKAAAGAVPGVREVDVTLVDPDDLQSRALAAALRQGGGSSDPRRPSEPPRSHEDGAANPFMRPGSRTRVIGVSSGKGGVGKSSVTVNLAVSLARLGHRVAVLDADVYGFSVPKMLGLDRAPVIVGDLLIPPSAHGIRCLSTGFFVADDTPVIWRGPMLHKALEQFLADAYWGDPDFLVVDMPPGTGDVALSLSQYLPRTEIVVVTTPQPAAQRVAQRSAYMARKLKLPVRGVVENMSWFTGDDGQRYELFGSGGGQSLAAALDVPLLAQVPLVPALREGGDQGVPIAVSDPEGEASQAVAALAKRVEGMGPARVYRPELTLR